MPAYQFKCAKGHEFSQFFKMEDRPDIAACTEPGCRASAKRVISATPAIFKGTGWGGKP